jgi:outer membrane receptor for ferrienterochelin and colicin
VLKVIYSGAFQNVDNWTKFSLAPDRQLNNPTLGPEKVRNLEISGTWNIFDYLSTDITYFRASYSDIVGTARVKYIDENGEEKETSQHQGVGTILIQGLQGNVNYKKGNYSAYLNYTFNHPYNTEQNKETRVGDIPDFSFNIGGNASFLKNKLNIHLRMNYVGEKPTGKNTTISKNPNDKIPAYTIFSGAVTYQLIKGLALQLYVNNILNKEYFHPGVRSAEGSYNAAIIPQNERNFMTKLLVDF